MACFSLLFPAAAQVHMLFMSDSSTSAHEGHMEHLTKVRALAVHSFRRLVGFCVGCVCLRFVLVL